MNDKNIRKDTVKEFLDIEEIIDIAETNNNPNQSSSPSKMDKPSFFHDNAQMPVTESKNLPPYVTKINKTHHTSNPSIQKNYTFDDTTVRNKSPPKSMNNNLNNIFNSFSNSSLFNQAGISNINSKQGVVISQKTKEDVSSNILQKERKSSPNRFNALFNNPSANNIKGTNNLNSNEEKKNPNNLKVISKVECPKYSCVKEYSYKEEKNPKYRNTMEDFCCIVDNFMHDPKKGFFGLYDGHGGVDSVNYVKDRMPDVLVKILEKSNTIEQALINSFHKVDDELKFSDSENTGCTACVVLIITENYKRYIYSANVGDTKSILISSDGVEQLSFDHKCTDNTEVERVKQVGGLVFNGRVFGQLVLTRALGDHALKKYGVISTPHVTKLQKEDKHKYIVIATDGIWDVITENDILQMSYHISSAEELSSLLIKTALNKGSKDNISCIVINL